MEWLRGVSVYDESKTAEEKHTKDLTFVDEDHAKFLVSFGPAKHCWCTRCPTKEIRQGYIISVVPQDKSDRVACSVPRPPVPPLPAGLRTRPKRRTTLSNPPTCHLFGITRATGLTAHMTSEMMQPCLI